MDTREQCSEMSTYLAPMAAILIRIWLMRSNMFGLVERPELATPVNSFKRLCEGVSLYKKGLDPYSGVLFHETPLSLNIFSVAFDILSPAQIDYIFIAADMATAAILSSVANMVTAAFLRRQSKEKASYHEDARETLLVCPDSLARVSQQVWLVYLFHPYIVASCVAKTTAGFANFLLAAFLWTMLAKWTAASVLVIALATYQSVYPVMLFVPLILAVGPKPISVAKIVGLLTFALGTIYFASYLAMGQSWSFLESTAGFILAVPELTPNMGLFWYFFTEMFEQYRLLFVCMFQLNCFIYVYPLATRLNREPYLLSLVLIALTALFKSYPGYGDVGFYMALLPTVTHLLPYMKQSFIVATTFVATTVLGPILYQLWIFNGSANANYFFSITLFFGIAQIFLITDILFAHIMRQFHLEHGYKALMSNDGSKNGPTVQLL